MKKFFFALLFLVGILLVSPSAVSADDGSGSTLTHAYKPFTVAGTNWTRARINNNTVMAQKRLVCVEAFNNATNAKNHLGCLWVQLDPMGSNMWAKEFDAPTAWLNPGSYRVVYTYQDDQGMWQHIKSVNMQVWDGAFTR